MRTIIVGYGQIGIALYKILKEHYPIGVVDDKKEGADFEVLDSPYNQGNTVVGEYDILHICFPYSDEFISEVKRYQALYKPKYTVIHSTVPRGTSDKCGAIHSPIRGIHPNLESGIRTFPKFLGGKQASEVADYFRKAGLKVILYDKAETTEALKLFDTEYYRHCIEFAQRVKRYCDERGLNFSEVYTIPNQTYNEGYTKLGMSEVVRPVLQPIMKEIGGHCLIPNSKLIQE